MQERLRLEALGVANGPALNDRIHRIEGANKCCLEKVPFKAVFRGRVCSSRSTQWPRLAESSAYAGISTKPLILGQGINLGALPMGACDVSVFGNDDAADFSFEFDDVNTIAELAPVIENAPDTVLHSDPTLEAAAGAAGLAAAALVVAWDEPAVLGGDVDFIPQPWPGTSDPLPGRLTANAANTLVRMKNADGNELAQLWEESGQSAEFSAEISRWRARFA